MTIIQLLMLMDKYRHTSEYKFRLYNMAIELQMPQLIGVKPTKGA